MFDVATGELKKRIELAEVIPADRKQDSKCRFLAYKRSRIHIVDLGLNCIYVYNMNTNGSRHVMLNIQICFDLGKHGNII